MHVGDEINGGDINETGRGKREHIGDGGGNPIEQEIPEERARQGRKARQDVKKKSAATFYSLVEKEREIADFLRDFVEDNRQTGRYAQRKVGQKGGGDEYPIDKIVDAVTDEDERTGDPVDFAMRIVAMAPQENFFEEEKGDDTGQNRRHDGTRGGRFERMGEKPEKGHREKGADRIADEMGDDLPLVMVSGNEQKRCAQHGPDGPGKAEQEYPGKRHFIP